METSPVSKLDRRVTLRSSTKKNQGQERYEEEIKAIDARARQPLTGDFHGTPPAVAGGSYPNGRTPIRGPCSMNANTAQAATPMTTVSAVIDAVPAG